MYKPTINISKTLKSSKKHYSVDGKVFLANIAYCKKWYLYIDSQYILVITDYKQIIHLKTQLMLKKQ